MIFVFLLEHVASAWIDIVAFGVLAYAITSNRSWATAWAGLFGVYALSAIGGFMGGFWEREIMNLVFGVASAVIFGAIGWFTRPK